MPWADGQFATGAGDPDFTIKVSCDGSQVTVCNRGDAPGGSTTGVSVWTPNPDLCGGASGCNQALSTGMNAVSTLRGTCPIPSDIAPGDCLSVPCDMTGNPASYLHVNGCDEFACEPLAYITDGSTGNTCGYDGSAASRAVRVQPAADAFASDGVLFFTVALAGANMALLNDLVAAGGTTSAIDLRAVPDASLGTTLATELASIQGNLLSCTVPIPNAGTVDPATVVVTYEPSSGSDRPLTEVPNAAACSTADEFYFAPDPSNPTEVVMCSDICDTVRADTAGSVTFSGGCATRLHLRRRLHGLSPRQRGLLGLPPLRHHHPEWIPGSVGGQHVQRR